MKKLNDTISQPKRRGRKPKGGKLVNLSSDVSVTPSNLKHSAVIVHLNCCVSDIKSETVPEFTYSPNIEPIQTYSDVINDEKYEKYEGFEKNDSAPSDASSTINEKLRLLHFSLEHPPAIDTKSACFWCTCDYNNQSIHIPKYKMNNTYCVYGYFCSPECALAYLLNEHIDDSCKMERIHLLNNVYRSIYENHEQICPALAPHYSLDKFLGTLSIDEYRNLHQTRKRYTFIEKPMTLINPEFNEDSQHFGISLVQF